MRTLLTLWFNLVRDFFRSFVFLFFCSMFVLLGGLYAIGGG